jgi:alcohol dehydrogenase class IV
MQDAFAHEWHRTRLVARPGALAELAAEIEALGCRRPLVLAGTRSAASPLFDQVRRGLAHLSPAELLDVPSHSSAETVEAVARMLRDSAIDCLVAVGGGSVSDTAKAAAVVQAEGGPLARHATRFEAGRGFVTPPLLAPKLPIVSIPASASGAEVTPSFGVRAADGRKLLFRDAQVASRVVLIDPLANLCVPPQILLSSGMNGLAHALEALYARRRSPLSTVLAIDTIARFSRALPRLANDPADWRLRAEVLVAAHASGIVLATTGSCLHHAICHVLGSRLELSHGDVNSVILPHALAYNAEHAAVELGSACVALGIGTDPRSPGPLIELVRRLQRETGVPRRLSDLTAARERLPELAQDVLHERGLANNPVAVEDSGTILAILEAAW